MDKCGLGGIGVKTLDLLSLANLVGCSRVADNLPRCAQKRKSRSCVLSGSCNGKKMLRDWMDGRVYCSLGSALLWYKLAPLYYISLSLFRILVRVVERIEKIMRDFL